MIGLCSVSLPFLRVDCRQSSFRWLSQGSPGMEKVNDWEGNFPSLPQVTMYLLFPHSVAWFAHSSHYPEELLSLQCKGSGYFNRVYDMCLCTIILVKNVETFGCCYLFPKVAGFGYYSHLGATFHVLTLIHSY